MNDFEKLGVFYLGRPVDPVSGRMAQDPLLYRSRDLTTHAVCAGMTGSGKTGLCVSLIEEAAIDGVPAIVIDPKGDMGNLMLTFPKLSENDFLPWINSEDALRKGMTNGQYAGYMSGLWRDGLKEWGQSSARIRRLREAVDMCIYTPGSSAGCQLAVLKSLAAPTAEVREDTDLFQERISSAVSGLLALVGIDADPIRSREFILLSRILQEAWTQGKDMELVDLIQQIQDPPFRKVGVFNLDTFFPVKQRTGLAMTLNNLIASPGFAAWMEGDSMDVQSLLYTATGKPRVSIISIAHLSDAERMFFVTLLLNGIISWMRTQPGTGSLRALLYMDEIFGYFPPSANPPSKAPMLTLLKQARAYGLGVVLATQNPVDLDYKGLANTGTWWLGRLQTEQDRARVLDGLEGASASAGTGFDRKSMDQILSRLSSRMFIQHNVHEDGPVLFHSRWALSFLRGPLTRSQIKLLTPIKKADKMQSNLQQKPPVLEDEISGRQKLPADVDQKFIVPSMMIPEWARLVYRPALLARAKLHYSRVSLKVDHWVEVSFLYEPARDEVEPCWSEPAEPASDLSLKARPLPSSQFAPVPEVMTDSRSYAAWKKQFVQYLYSERDLVILKCGKLKKHSEPGESERDFRARIAQDVREQRDLKIAKIRKKYDARMSALEKRIVKAEGRLDRETDQYSRGRTSVLIAVGSALLGAVLGRSSTNVGRAATAMRTANRARGQKGDIARAQEDLALLREDVKKLESQCGEELQLIQAEYAPGSVEVETVRLRPLKTDVTVTDFLLVWQPWLVDEAGIAEKAWS